LLGPSISIEPSGSTALSNPVLGCPCWMGFGDASASPSCSPPPPPLAPPSSADAAADPPRFAAGFCAASGAARLRPRRSEAALAALATAAFRWPMPPRPAGASLRAVLARSSTCWASERAPRASSIPAPVASPKASQHSRSSLSSCSSHRIGVLWSSGALSLPQRSALLPTLAAGWRTAHML
jgi:hypothetical protein